MFLTLPYEPIEGLLSFLPFLSFWWENYLQWFWLWITANDSEPMLFITYFSIPIHLVLVWLCTLAFVRSSAHFEIILLPQFVCTTGVFSDFFFLFWWSFSVYYTFIYLRIACHLMHLCNDIYGILVVCFKNVGILDLPEGKWNCKESNKGFLVHDLLLLHFSQEFYTQ